MKRGLCLLLLAVCCLTVFARRTKPDTMKFRIIFRDKAATVYSLSRPEAFLSERALSRRARQHLEVDSTDLPVCEAYIRQVEALGVKRVACGKWENFLTVSCRDTSWLARARAFPFVKEVRMVWRQPVYGETGVPVRDTLALRGRIPKGSELYGTAATQIGRCGGDKLHAAGFRGRGIWIAVTDAGFHNADRMEAMRQVRVEGTRDFVVPPSDLFAESAHGLSVLSCMAACEPGRMVGTAPEASYWLLRTEDEASETPVEQDYWAEAVEFADSVGVDVVCSSLGYNVFDDAVWNYAYRQLDGRHALMSRQASRMADKGMVLVCSAGNAGQGTWKKITIPADAHDVLAVGAVDEQGVLAPFSSIGNTADGRVKPDVVAVGKPAAVIRADGTCGWADGTSFAAPVVCGLVACLWQALPSLTARELIDRVREAGHQAACPDNIYGYGEPDFWHALSDEMKKEQ